MFKKRDSLAYRPVMASLVVLCFIDGVSSSRLRLTPSKVSGLNLVEVFHNGEWGTICDDSVNLWLVGQVICWQLGNANVTNITSISNLGYIIPNDAAATEHIWLDNIDCAGNESSIDACNHRPWGIEDCGHHEDVLVHCSACSLLHCQAGMSVCSSNGSVCMECKPPYITAGWNRGCRRPTCAPACRNNGTCISDNTCRCQAGFQGRLCELGGKLDEFLKPRLHVVEDDILSPLAWYNSPTISNNNRLCFIKIGFQGKSLDTILTAESLNSAGEIYGNYSMGPVDANAGINGTKRVVCLQVKCPAFDGNGSEQYTTVRVTASTTYETCRIRPKSFKMENITLIPSSGRNEALQCTLEPGNNYGPYFGIYINQGYREKAKYISERSCFCGRDYKIDGINPLKNTLANYVCA